MKYNARYRMIMRTIHFDAEEGEEEREAKPKKVNHGNTRLPYGLCKEFGIDTTGMTPRQCWAALEGEGITPAEAFSSFNKVGSKKGTINRYVARVKRGQEAGIRPKGGKKGSTTKHRPEGAKEDTPLTHGEVEYKLNVATGKSDGGSRVGMEYDDAQRNTKALNDMLTKSLLDNPASLYNFSTGPTVALSLLNQIKEGETDEMDKKRIEHMRKVLHGFLDDESFIWHKYPDFVNPIKRLEKKEIANARDAREVAEGIGQARKEVGKEEFQKSLKGFSERHPEVGEKIGHAIKLMESAENMAKQGVDGAKKAAQTLVRACKNDITMEEAEKMLSGVESSPINTASHSESPKDWSKKLTGKVDEKYPEAKKTMDDVEETFADLKKNPDKRSYGSAAMLMKNVHNTLMRTLRESVRDASEAGEEYASGFKERNKNIKQLMATADVTRMFYEQKDMQERLEGLKKHGAPKTEIMDETSEYDKFIDNSLHTIDAKYKRDSVSPETYDFIHKTVRPTLMRAKFGGQK